MSCMHAHLQKHEDFKIVFSERLLEENQNESDTCVWEGWGGKMEWVWKPIPPAFDGFEDVRNKHLNIVSFRDFCQWRFVFTFLWIPRIRN